MKNGPSVNEPCGYVVTPEGRQGLQDESCFCQVTLDAGLITCKECGTCYGLVKQIRMNVGPMTLVGKRD